MADSVVENLPVLVGTWPTSTWTKEEVTMNTTEFERAWGDLMDTLSNGLAQPLEALKEMPVCQVEDE